MAAKITFIFLVVLNLVSFAQVEMKKNFSFEQNPYKQDFWGLLPKTVSLFIERNTTEKIDGESSWCIVSTGSICSRLLLPPNPRKTDISISSKTRNLKDAWIKVYYLDIEEHVLKRDSCSIVSSEKWGKYDFQSDENKVYSIYVEIGMSIERNLKKEQQLFLDDLHVKINDSDYLTLPCEPGPRDRTKSALGKKQEVVNDETIVRSIVSIKDFDQPKIIAMAETVHGSDNIQCCVFETTKYLIQNRNCRLVLFEIPFELGLWFNEYVLGDVSEEVLNSKFFGVNFNYSRLINFLNWIRNYNKYSKEKVTLAGIDVLAPLSLQWVLGFDHLRDFVRNQKALKSDVNPFFDYISKHNYTAAKDFVLSNSSFDKLDKNKRELLVHALELRVNQQCPDLASFQKKREYLQYNNTMFLVNFFLKNKEKAVIYGHFNHLNKRGGYVWAGLNFPNFGHFLYQSYPHDYFVCALLVGNGQVTDNNNDGLIASFELALPCVGSIEQLCDKQNKPFLYQRTSTLEPTGLCRFFSSSNDGEKQFYICNMANRCDAVIYLKHSDGYKWPDHWPKTKEEFKEYIDKQRMLNGRDKW